VSALLVHLGEEAPNDGVAWPNAEALTAKDP
jgi:hypothetical protein